MRTGTFELLNDKEATVAAADNSYKDATKYCDFYKLNLGGCLPHILSSL